jgi:glucose-1-phosphate thymidylyltransferase
MLLKEVHNPQRFGAPVFDGDGMINVEGKPAVPASKNAVIGIYMYNGKVFDSIKILKPSQKGRLEITDVNSFYIHEGKIGWDIIAGWWSGCGDVCIAQGCRQYSRENRSK